MTNTTNYGLNVVQTTDRILADVEAIGENAETIDKLCNGTLEGETITTTFGNTRLGDWEIYGNATQNGTPTPSTPVAVNVVTGENYINTNKNLLPVLNSTRTINDVTFTPQADGSILVNGTASAQATYVVNYDVASVNRYLPLKANTTYYLSKSGDAGISNITCQAKWYKTGATQYTSANGSFTTVDANTMSVYIRVASGVQITNTKIYVQLEENSSSTSFVKSGTMYVNLGSLELAKIGDYADYLYRSGSKWFKHSEVKKGTIASVSSVGTASSGVKYAQIGNINDALKNGTVLCNKYTNSSSAANNNAIRLATLLLIVYDNTFTTQAIAETALIGLNYYYPLATPTDTEITDSTLIGQLNNLCKLKTSTGTSTGTSTIQVSTSNATPSKLKVYLYNEAQSKLIDRLDSLEARVTILE